MFGHKSQLKNIIRPQKTIINISMNVCAWTIKAQVKAE